MRPSDRQRCGATPVEAGRLVPGVALGERDAELESDEVVGCDEGPNREVASQAADGRHAQDAVTTDVGEGSHVRAVIDERRRDELVEPVALDHDVASGVEQRRGTVDGVDVKARGVRRESSSEDPVAAHHGETPHGLKA